MAIATVGLMSTMIGCAMPLLNSAASGDAKKVGVLLQDGHQADEAFPLVGTRPLMVAAANGHIETVRLLLDAGADINAHDITGWTALHAGALNGNAPLVSLLLSSGAVQRSSWWLHSPLEIAEALDHKDIIPLLRRPGPALAGQPMRPQ